MRCLSVRHCRSQSRHTATTLPLAPGQDIVIETLTLVVCLPILVYDRPITADDCRHAVDMVMHGVTRNVPVT